MGNQASRAWTVGLLLAVLFFAGCLGGKAKANSSPIAEFTVTPGADTFTWSVDGSASRDPDGDVLTYHWDWTLGNASTPKADIVIPSNIGNGTFPIILTVRDPKGAFGSSIDRATLVYGGGVNQNPTANIADAVRWVKPDTTVTLDASPTVDPDGDPVTVEWIFGAYNGFDPSKPSLDQSDPLTTPNSDLEVFNSALMGPGQKYNLTFDKEGTYNYVCHPHPWMQGRLVVDPAIAEASTVNIDMEGYAFTNNSLRVGKGSTVVFTNKDLDEHTASAMDYTSATEPAVVGTTFTKSLPEGDHVVRMIATDGKGGRVSASYGLKASSDAPEPAQNHEWAATPETVLIGSVPDKTTVVAGTFRLNWTASMTLTLSWQDPSAQAVVGNVSVGPQGGNAVGCSYARTGAEVTRGPCRITPPELNTIYEVVVTIEGNTGVLDWEVSATGTEFLSAGYGDYNAARCHLHPPAPPHCI